MKNLRSVFTTFVLFIGTFLTLQYFTAYGTFYGSMQNSAIATITVVVSFGSFALVTYLYFLENEKKRITVDNQIEAISLANLIVVHDIAGFILTANSNFLDLTGWEKKEVTLGRSDKFVEDPEHNMDVVWKKLEEGTSVSGEFRWRKSDGSFIWVSSTLCPIKDRKGSVYQVVEIAFDITEVILGRDTIRRKNKYLEYAAKLLRHDMNAGLNIYLPRGVRSIERKLPPEIIEEYKLAPSMRLVTEGLTNAQIVYQGVCAFTNLVKDDAKLDVFEEDIGQMLKDYLNRTSYSDQVHISKLPNLLVNKYLFCSAIDNLIRNGLKYNDSAKKMVTIEMWNKGHLCVRDNGRGLTQEELLLYCRPYERREGQVEDGTGLGLNITVAIIEEHKFDIFIDETQTQGTCVVIKFKEDTND